MEQVFFNVPLAKLEPIFKRWIIEAQAEVLPKQVEQKTLPAEDPLNDLISKSEVRGKLASASTLWKWEKSGKIQSYGIGGKRFYKRSELMAAIIKLKK